MTAEELARRLADGLARGIAAARATALAEATTMRDEAHDTLGTMGGPAGDWAHLANATMQSKARAHQLGRVSAEDTGYASGELRESLRVDDTDPDKPRVVSADPVLAYFEHGTSSQQPRPLLAPIAAEHAHTTAQAIGAAFVEQLRAALRGT